MSLLSLLLRVLLSLGLVLNGAGSALASAHLSLAGQPGPAENAHSAPGSQHERATCHEEGPSVVGEPLLATAAARADASPHDSGNHSKCCDPESCRCSCLHGFSVAVPMMADDTVLPMQQGMLRVLVPAHDTPALPHLIRPPIV